MRLRPHIFIAALVLLPILYVASSAPVLRWAEGTHGGAVLTRKAIVATTRYFSLSFPRSGDHSCNRST